MEINTPSPLLSQGEGVKAPQTIAAEQCIGVDQKILDSARSSDSCLGCGKRGPICSSENGLPPAPATEKDNIQGFPACAAPEDAELDNDVVPFHNESDRLAALTSLGMIEREPEPRFDSITSLMKAIFNTPISSIALIAEDVIHFHSRAGEWAPQAPRKGSFCERILERRHPRMLIVEDAQEDARFCQNKYVKGPPYIRFYCGAPLVGSTGYCYGTLCVIDFTPRHFTAEQYLLLSHFAELATRELERDYVVRNNNTKLRAALHSANATTGHVLRAMDALEEAVMLTDISQPNWPVLYSNSAWGKATGTKPFPLVENPFGEAPLEPTPLFWELFNSRTVDVGDVTTALAAARTSQAFTLTVRSPVHEGHAITLRFKPASEPGRLGAAPMPQVALPSGIGLDWMTEQPPNGGEPVPMPPPQFHRVHAVAPNLTDSKRAALAAALSVVSGKGIDPGLANTNSISDVACAAVAAVGTVHEQAVHHQQQQQQQAVVEDTGPVYYLCVILRQGPLPPPPRKFPVSPFAAIPTSISASEDANNEYGSCRLSPNVSEGYPSSANGAGVSSVASPEQLAVEMACAANPWDSVKSNDSLPVQSQLPNQTSMGSLSFSGLQPNQSSGAWGITDRPPASLGGLSLGAMVGSGRGGRCYRGMWRHQPTAVKIVDLWEESVDGGSSSPHSSTASAPASPAVPDSMEPFGRALGGLPNHLNLVPVLASAIVPAPSGLPDRVHLQVWILEEYCNRGGLGDAIDTGLLKNKNGKGGPDVVMVLLTARDIAAGLKHLHLSGIVHGNLTGNNVLLTTDKQDRYRGWRALVDGYALAASRANVAAGASNENAGNGNIAAATAAALSTISHDSLSSQNDRQSSTGTNNGWYGAQPQHRIGSRKFKSVHKPSSPAHLPPEVLLGEVISEATDSYSMGVLLWELWSGRRAWRTLGPNAVVQAVALQGCQLPVPNDAPFAYADLMRRCFSEDPDARPCFNEIVDSLDDQILMNMA